MSISPGLKWVVVNLLSHTSTYMSALLEKFTSAGSRLIILPPSCKFKVKPTILTKIKHIIYTPTSKVGDPNMDGTTGILGQLKGPGE